MSEYRRQNGCLVAQKPSIAASRYLRPCLASLIALATIFSNAATAQTASGIGIRSLDIYGKACFTTEGVARPQTPNSRLFNHVVVVKNRCPKSVKLKICYHKTERCTEVTVPPHETKEAWLGMMPVLRLFQYDLKELRGIY